jgi:hypothetical protein
VLRPVRSELRAVGGRNWTRGRTPIVGRLSSLAGEGGEGQRRRGRPQITALVAPKSQFRLCPCTPSHMPRRRAWRRRPSSLSSSSSSPHPATADPWQRRRPCSTRHNARPPGATISGSLVSISRRPSPCPCGTAAQPRFVSRVGGTPSEERRRGRGARCGGGDTTRRGTTQRGVGRRRAPLPCTEDEAEGASGDEAEGCDNPTRGNSVLSPKPLHLVTKR